MNLNARLIAFYLPQYHPIPENDKWWGKGFTEWTNVAKSKPLFKGHYQPHLPADLGFYDLRVPEVRQAQADMAREHGIEGFCYWHYWFAGKRLLERPFNEVLHSGKPDFPFCLAWANESWTGIWYGAPKNLLIEQTYPGIQDYKNHFLDILPALRDPRYLTVDNKPIFIIYKPSRLPESKKFTDLWRNLAKKNGLEGLYLLGMNETIRWDYQKDGFDGVIVNTLSEFLGIKGQIDNQKRLYQLFRKITQLDPLKFIRQIKKQPVIYSYEDFVNTGLPELDFNNDQYPNVLPNWDNTPRSNLNGIVLKDSTPNLFGIQLQQALSQVRGRVPDKRLVFVKSWNEWAEGNYLEPDIQFGMDYLRVIKKLVNTF